MARMGTIGRLHRKWLSGRPSVTNLRSQIHHSGELVTQPVQQKPQRPLWRKILPRLLFLALALAVLYFFLPTIYGFVDETEKLATIDWWWFVLMAVLMSGAFVAAWELNRIALLGVSRFVVGTSQLVSNALSKVIPGGAVAAGATLFQMLGVSGIPRQQAATALAAVAFISNLVLFSLPAVALLIAAISAPIPEGLLPVAIAGSVLFAVMFLVVVVLVKFDQVMLFVGHIIESVIGWLASKFHKPWTSTAEDWLHTRNDVVEALGKRWYKALAAAVANWLLDYLVLVTALFAIGAEPRPSLVLVAFAGAAVLGMIPITPGGIGFVEFGLVGMLVASGIPAPDATLATLAYRLFQFWLPIPAGAVAYVLFKRKYGKPADLQQAT
jgi:uncharacterized protein (TIRG00374 family)